MQPYLVKLPPERGQQLKELSILRRKPIVELVADWINREIAGGVLPDSLLGIVVSASAEGIEIAINGVSLKGMSSDDAMEMARVLASIATTRGAWEASHGPDLLTLDRVGSGVRLRISSCGKTKIRRVMACSVARDFARIIRQKCEVEMRRSA